MYISMSTFDCRDECMHISANERIVDNFNAIIRDEGQVFAIFLYIGALTTKCRDSVGSIIIVEGA